MKYRTKIDGLLVVDKPKGLSSMDVVRRVRRAAGHCKTGHAGTLDPLATGVVICCLGSGTKAVSRLMGATKIYETTVDLTGFTDTDDAEAPVRPVAIEFEPMAADIEAALPAFVGLIRQRPPAYSAIHINGERSYKLARRGEAAEVPEREVQVDGIELLSYTFPKLTLRIVCGKGTYIRAIGRDLGISLGTGGYLADLRRTAVGDYHVDQAVSIERLDDPITQDDLLPLPDPEPQET